jgi:hypothetical protein
MSDWGFEKQTNWTGFVKWRSENCDKCSRISCNDWLRQLAFAQTWKKDFTNEPECNQRVV